MQTALRRVAFLAVIVVVWHFAARSAGSFLFPTPAEVGESILQGVKTGVLPRAIGKSMQRLAVGYGLSLCIGLVLGFALARSQTLRDTVGSLVLGLQAIPSVCWMPVALLWFGLNEKAIQMVIVLGSLLSVSIATESAVRNVQPLYLRAASTMGAKGFTLYTRVVLPAALPGIVSGARLGWTFAWRSLMAGELLFVSGGLGQVLETGRELYDMAQVVGVMVVIVAVGLMSEHVLFGRLEARIRQRWGLDRG
jgi:NitT/TauT family transport system permease protein